MFFVLRRGKKMLWKFTMCSSVGNSHRSASPRPTTLEEDRKLFVKFSLILCLWFEIQGLRTYNFFDWISNTDVLTLLTGLFHKSESADLESKWKLTRTYIYHLHQPSYTAQIACRKFLRWFFVRPCLDCLQSLGKGGANVNIHALHGYIHSSSIFHKAWPQAGLRVISVTLVYSDGSFYWETIPVYLRDAHVGI